MGHPEETLVGATSAAVIVMRRDLLAFDPELKKLYGSAESGNVTVFGENGKTLMRRHVSLRHNHTVSVDTVRRIMEPTQSH